MSDMLALAPGISFLITSLEAETKPEAFQNKHTPEIMDCA